MTSAPVVTVCIPTYNRAHFLRESIPSVLAQSCSDFRILVSDNASTDNTAEVVAQFGDPRISYVRQPRNIGLAPNLRSVVERASESDTEFVAVLSDDDLFLPDHLTTALDMLRAYPQAAYYSCPAIRFGDGITGLLKLGSLEPINTDEPATYYSPREAVKFLGLDTPGPIMTAVGRREVFMGLYWGKPDYVPVDLLVMPQIMLKGGFVLGHRPTAKYRTHGANVSHPHNNRPSIIRIICMEWYGIRWITQMLLDKGICTLADIEAHGLQASSPDHVVPLALSLGSFDSPPALRAIARRVFRARTDMDRFSARFRLARRVGFWVIPWLEKIEQTRVGWHP